MRKLKIRVDNKNKATNQEIVDNLDRYTFQYALNEIGTGFVQFFRMGLDDVLKNEKTLIDFEFNELLSCYEKPLNEVANRIIKLNKMFNKKDIKKIYNNEYFRNIMLQLQKEVGTSYVFDLQKYKKGEPEYIKELISLLIYFKVNYDIIMSLVDKLEINKNTKTYLKTTMTKFRRLNQDIENEIVSERQQFMAEKKKRNYNANVKYIIKNWHLNF
jgi:signal recognition particle GTPase